MKTILIVTVVSLAMLATACTSFNQQNVDNYKLCTSAGMGVEENMNGGINCVPPTSR